MPQHEPTFPPTTSSSPPATEDAEPEAPVTRGMRFDVTDPSHASVQRFRLVVTAGPDAGASFVSKGERCIVGTHESAEVRLRDETVSRFHCEIDPEDGRALVRDLGSRNGTRVDGVSVLAAHLHAGARLTLGRTEILFEVRSDRTKLPISPREHFGRMVGSSTPMRRVFKLLEEGAASNATVLLEGETGTGKEVAAESIHQESPRKERPFIVVDCGAIPPDLLESELFGHERGSFTGATGTREGAFEAADGGTIFLDEIGELPLDLQPKLLRALDKREIKRVGSTKHFGVDVRVVAATNRDLRREVNEKRFRADLYYRLAVVQVQLPPLRERLDDLAALTEAILASLEPHYPGRTERMASPEFLSQLARHAWPGNVRELRNYLERCLALRTTRISVNGDAAPPSSRAPASVSKLADPRQPLKVARERWTEVLERHYLEEMLRRNGDNVTAAARAAEVDRMHFYRLLWRHGLR